MNGATYSEVFAKATGCSHPYGYQCRLACGPDADPENKLSLKTGTACASQLIEIPTGLGKTAGVVLAWLWNRVLHTDEKHRSSWPRRLVYCLPMRTLVEQTHQNVHTWLKAINKLWDGKNEHTGKVGLHVLMGGEEVSGWDLYPEQNAILIGTQDMLLSRALNRGYGMSRYRWPMHFGLLNNDALWVMDETQLMGPALWTSAQLDWMRADRFQSLLPCKTWWMSATAGTNFLETSDRSATNFPKPKTFLLDIEPGAATVLRARRPCVMWAPSGRNRAKGKKSNPSNRSPEAEFSEALAAAIIDQHQQGTLSLVICNTVATAQVVFESIRAATGNKIESVLLTSQFRPCDRRAALDKLVSFEEKRKKGEAVQSSGLICVSTQVVEAGADISAVRLWSEIAPWASIVQRLGRLNRDGQDNNRSRALFFRVPGNTKPKRNEYIGPYSAEAVAEGEDLLLHFITLQQNLPDLSAFDALHQLQNDKAIASRVSSALRSPPSPYPRAIDVHGLFSTEPDVFGGFTDISPFIRDNNDSADVTVFWRADGESQLFPPIDLSGPSFDSSEGCTINVLRLREFIREHGRAFHWDPDAGKWTLVRRNDIWPGMVIMLPASAGGYNRTTGWTGDRRQQLEELPLPGPFSEIRNADRLCETGEWLALGQHLEDTQTVARRIVRDLPFRADLKNAITSAAGLHDIGKALPKWQDAIPNNRPDAKTIWAKFAKSAHQFRPNCRHEAASALALWHRYFYEGADFPALTIYLVAAHHGKVRTVLRSWNEYGSDVCGVPISSPPLPWNGGMPMDFQCALDGAEGEFSSDGTMFFYRAPGWTALITDLLGGWESSVSPTDFVRIRDQEPVRLGPFTLAYLEAITRAADQIASASSSQIV